MSGSCNFAARRLALLNNCLRHRLCSPLACKCPPLLSLAVLLPMPCFIFIIKYPQILDVASASGEPAASLAAALPLATVHATDLTPRFVELGAARAARLGLRNLRCQVADGERLERFGDASCDAVCCCMGLM